jgi:hypothetical protein
MFLKNLKKRLERLQMRFDPFANTFRHIETCFLKTYFLTSGEVKNAF